MVLIFSIGHISASEIDDNTTSSQPAINNVEDTTIDNNVLGSTDPVIEDVNTTSNEKLESSEPKENLSAEDNSFTALQNEINAVTAGGTLVLQKNYLYQSTYDIDLIKGIVVNKKITIDGQGKYSVDGAGAARIFRVQSPDVTFQNMLLTRAWVARNDSMASSLRHGGAIWFDSTSKNAAVINCNFTKNRVFQSDAYSSRGGAIYWEGKDGFTAINCNFKNDNNIAARLGAGIYVVGSNVFITNSTFDTMRVEDTNGGSICSEATSYVNFTLTNCKFINTWAAATNGAVYIAHKENITVVNNLFDKHYAYDGNLYVVGGNHINLSYNNFTNFNATYEPGIIVHGACDDLYVGYNKFENVSGSATTDGVNGYRIIDIRGGATTCGNATIEYNNLTNIFLQSHVNPPVGIEISGYFDYVNIYNNIFTNVSSRCIGVIKTVCPTYIENNTFTNFRLHPRVDTDVLRGIGIWSTNFTYIKGNVFDTSYVETARIPYSVDGVIYISETGSAIIDNNTFKNNHINVSSLMHTGIISNNGNNTNITNNIFYDSNCTGALGGFIYNTGDNVKIYNNNFTNIVAMSGGAIYNTADNLKVMNNNFTNINTTGDGGAFYIIGQNINITNNNFKNIHADGSYGVIYLDTQEGSYLANNNYTNNYATDQGVLAIGNGVTVNNEKFNNNHVSNGQAGTILIMGDNNNLTNININNTYAITGGAIYNRGNNNKLNKVNITNTKSTEAHGGAIYSIGDYLSINGLNVESSTAAIDGGAVYNSGSNGEMINANFTNVNASNNGGVIFWSGAYGTISYINIKNAFADGYGGAIYWTASDGLMDHITVNNVHSTIGGAVYCVGARGNLTYSLFTNVYANGDGGAIYWTGSIANLTSIDFKHINSTANGGAIYGTAVDSFLIDLSFEDVNATGNGGAINWAGTQTTLSDLDFINVSSAANGGAIFFTGDKSTFKKGSFKYIKAVGNGGAIYWTSTSSSMADVDFINCTADDMGGALYWTGSSSNVSGTTFTNCSASNGGAILWNAANGKLNNSKFNNNIANGNGGAIYWIGSEADLYNLTLSNNNATFKGGAINILGNGEKLRGIFADNNWAGVDGGAIIMDGSECDLYDSNFTNNDATVEAGAIYWAGNEGIINNINFTNNSAGIGGALYWSADYADISNVNFKGNNASNTAGALYMGGLIGGKLVDCTFDDNNASVTGGALYWSGSNGNLTRCTFNGANADSGGAIYWSGDNSILSVLNFVNVNADENGGIIYISASNVTVIDSNFYNSSAGSGGAIYWSGSEGNLRNNNFENNSASMNGGAIYWIGNNANITNVNIFNNTAGIDGGALYIISYGAMLDDVNFLNNTALNYGGAIYWGGTGNISNSNFTYNKGFSGSAIYNSGSLNIESTDVLKNKANISYIEINKVEEQINMYVDAILHGNDNFLNAIWTTSSNILVNNVTYYGVNGETTSDENWIRPVEGASESELYYDDRLAGMPITVTYVHEGSLILSYNGITDIWGNYSYFGTKLAEGNYNVTATHDDDEYYFGKVHSEILGIGVITPNVTISLNGTEFYYDTDVFISGSIVAMDTLGHLYTVHGDVDIYVDDKFINLTVPVTNSMYHITTGLPDEFGVGLHNISAYYYNGEDDTGKDIGSAYSSPFYFNIVKNYLPSLVDVSTNKSTYYVDEVFNITMYGPLQYTGDVYYVAGSISGYCQLENGTFNVPVSYSEEGHVNVLVYVLGDENYLPSSSSCSFDIIKYDLSIEFANISGTSLGTINVGDNAIIQVNLSANDTTGDVIINIDGADYILPINGSSVVLNISGLNNGVHTVTARYPGNNKYNEARLITATLTAKKVDLDSFNVSVDKPNVYVGDNVTFTICLNATDNIKYPFNGVVNVTFDGRDYDVVINNGVGYLTVDNLAYNNYSIRVAYAGDYQFNANSFVVNNVVNVSKISTNIVITPLNPVISVMDSVLFNISVNAAKYNVTGYVNVNVAGRDYIVYINEGKGSLNVSDLKYDANPYIVDVVYDGDNQFINSSTSTSIIVGKYNISSITAKVNNTIYAGEDALLNITVNSDLSFNDFVTVKVNGSEYLVYVSDGKVLFNIHGLEYSPNPYAIEVSYNGSDVFNPYANVVTTNVRVNKHNINDIGVSVSSPVYVGDDIHMNITIDSDNIDVNGFVTVKVNNKEYNVSIIDDYGVLVLPSLNEGVYDVFVNYAGDNVFNPFNNYAITSIAQIKVNKIATSLSMSDVVINVGNVAVIIARINSTDATGNVTFTVDNKKYVSGVVDGVAKLEVYNLNTSADSVIYANYSGDSKFINSSTTANLIVNKVSDSATISVYDLIAGEVENVIIVLPSDVTDGIITVRFNGTPVDYNISNNVITFNRTIQSAGVYNVNVSVVDDVKYNNISASKDFIAYLDDSYDIMVNVDNVLFGENATVKVTLPADAVDGIVKINGLDYTVNDAKNGVVLPAEDTTGVHTIDVQYVNSSTYDEKVVTASYRVYKAGSNVSIDMDSVFYAGDDIHFTVTTVNSTGEITVIILNNVYQPINSTEYVINGGLANGTYTVIVKLDGDDNYYGSDTSKVIMVNKKDVSLVLDNIGGPFNVDDNVLINAKFNNNVSGNVIFNIDGVNYTVNVNNDDHISFNYIPHHNGTYSVSAFYAGNDKFNPKTSAASSFVVNKLPTNLIISANPIYVGQDAIIEVEVNNVEATGGVNITVNGKSYNVILNNGRGSVSVSGLTNSTNNNIAAYYSGDNKFAPSSSNSNVVVNKIDINDIVINNQEIYVGEEALLDVFILPSIDTYMVNGFVTVKIDNKEYNVSIVDNSGHLAVSGLGYGTYYVNASYNGDVYYNSFIKNNVSNIVVNKVDIVYIDVSADEQIIYIGDDAVFNINVKPRLNNYLVNGYLFLAINGTSYNVAIINNTGRLVVHGLGFGSHLVNVSYNGDDVYNLYNMSNVASVSVIKIPIDINIVPEVQSIFVDDVAELDITVISSVDNHVLNGIIIVYVENTPYNVSISNNEGKLLVSDLAYGVYNVNAFYPGDDEFELKYALHLASIIVNKKPTTIHIDDININVGDVANIQAVINESTVTGNVIFIVDNKEYGVGIVDGVARLNVSGLNTSSNKTITAIYSGDYKFVNSTTTTLLKISKVSGNASIVVYDITAGETETVLINLPSDITNGTISVKFNNEDVYDYIINNNVISFNRTLQTAGNYKVDISVVDDCKYNNFANSTSFTVSKVSADNYTIIIDVNDTSVFENIPVIIRLPADANKTLSLSVDNVPIASDIIIKDGIATYTLDNLSSGNHTISVSYGDDKYDDKTVTGNVFVSKIDSSINIINPVDARVAHDMIINVIPTGSTGDITVLINNKTYTVKDRSVVNASGLLEGNYTVVVKLDGDDNYFESNNASTFVVSRNNISMSLNNITDEVLVDSPVVIRANLTENVTGSVTFTINNMNYTVNITESDYAEYIWTPKNEGNVIVSASYSGNDTYYPCTSDKDISFVVSRNLARISEVVINDIMVGDVENIIVSLNVTDVTGVIFVNVNGTLFEANVDGGLAFVNIPDLPAGDYKVSIIYPGDNKYYPLDPYLTGFTVSKYNPPINITANDIMVLDDAIVEVNLPEDINDLITITVGNKSVNVVLVDGYASWTISDLPADIYNVNVIYSGNAKYNPNNANSSFIVYKYNSTFNVNVSDVFWTGDDNNISAVLSDDATGNVTVSINGTNHVLPVVNGTVDFTVPELAPGDYEAIITYSGDNKYDSMAESFNFTVIDNHPVIEVDDLVKYYKGPERLYVNLTTVRGDKLVNETLYITINGVKYTRVTNVNGTLSLPINLPSGDYVALINYESEKYGVFNETAKVSVLSTIVSTDLDKVYRNASQFYAYFTDSNGNALINTTVTFNINGVFYNRTTNASGWAKLNINLPAGEYIITSYNHVTGEVRSNLIHVYSRITENYDMVKVYGDGTPFSVCIIGDNGETVGAGEKVTFNINGVYYTRSTNMTGYVSLNINLPSGVYIITTSYEGCVVSNRITILNGGL